MGMRQSEKYAFVKLWRNPGGFFHPTDHLYDKESHFCKELIEDFTHFNSFFPT